MSNGLASGPAGSLSAKSQLAATQRSAAHHSTTHRPACPRPQPAHQRAGRQSRRRPRWDRARRPGRRGCTPPTRRQTRGSQTALQAAARRGDGGRAACGKQGGLDRGRLAFGPKVRKQGGAREGGGWALRERPLRLGAVHRHGQAALTREALWPEGVGVLPQVWRPAGGRWVTQAGACAQAGMARVPHPGRRRSAPRRALLRAASTRKFLTHARPAASATSTRTQGPCLGCAFSPGPLTDARSRWR